MQSRHAFGFRAERDFMHAWKLRLQIDLFQAGLGGQDNQRAFSRVSFDLPPPVTPGQSCVRGQRGGSQKQFERLWRLDHGAGAREFRRGAQNQRR